MLEIRTESHSVLPARTKVRPYHRRKIVAKRYEVDRYSPNAATATRLRRASQS